MSKKNYEADPQWAFTFHKENAEGVDREATERLHTALLHESLGELRNGNVSPARRKALWEWFLDVLVRDEAVAGTFRACCAVINAHPFSLLSGLVRMHKEEVTTLFGSHVVNKVLTACEDATNIREDDLASSCATWRNSPRSMDQGRMH